METELVVLCREINKQTGEITAYKVGGTPAGETLFCLEVRQRANPELQYFVCGKKNFTENDGMILKQLRRRKITEQLLSALNVIHV